MTRALAYLGLAVLPVAILATYLDALAATVAAALNL